MANTITKQVRRLRAEVLERTDTDPILNFNFMAAEAGLSLASFKRDLLPHLPVVALTEHRRGVRRSDWLALLESRTREPGAPAASTIEEFCERHGLSSTEADGEIEDGRLKVRRVGRRRIVTPEAEEAWLAALEQYQPAA
jgi:hypothetical protein